MNKITTKINEIAKLLIKLLLPVPILILSVKEIFNYQVLIEDYLKLLVFYVALISFHFYNKK